MDILRDKIVLVAAADAGSREAVTEEFRGKGCRVLSVTGGIEAYEMVRERHVDVVIAASRLTSGDPSILLSDIRRLSYDVPVVLFGAAGEKISQTEALHRGFAAYFLQAFPAAPLVDAAARSLEFVEERKKKKVERVAVAATAELEYGEPPARMSAPVLNISHGGIFVSLDRGFPAVQATVSFRLTLTKAEEHPPLEGKAVVRWVRERPGSGHLPGAGLEFTEMNDTARDFIHGYVERMSHQRR